MKANKPPTHVFTYEWNKFPHNHSIKCTKLIVFNKLDKLFNGNIRLECKCKSKY